MVKSELSRILAAKYRLSKSQADSIIDTVFQSIRTALAEDDRVELRGFGSFFVKHRDARTARNPKTGAPAQVPEKRIIAFKAGKRLREQVDK